MSGKALNSKQVTAAALCAADELTNAKIAEQVGVSERTLDRWLTEPLFLDAMAEHNRRIQAAMLRLDIAKRHKRVGILDDQLKKALRVQEARAEAYADDPDAHGGETGLIVKTVKQIGGGQNAQTVTEYQVDTALQKQIESLMERAAKELGQEVERTESGGVVTVQLVNVDLDQL